MNEGDVLLLRDRPMAAGAWGTRYPKGKEQRLKALLAAVDAASASQAELAHEAGISESSIYLYRMGIRHPSQRLCRSC